MILTDREIRISLERKLIEIDPAPLADAFSSTAVDLTLDGPFRFYKDRSHSLDNIVDPGRPGFSIKEAIDALTVQKEIDPEGFSLEPGNLILAWTRESVNLKTKSRVAARVEGKSSLARLGLLVHLTAPTIHAGFSRPIQLEVHQRRKSTDPITSRHANMSAHSRADFGRGRSRLRRALCKAGRC